MPRYFAQFRDLTGRTILFRSFSAEDDDDAMRKANGHRLQALKRIGESERRADSPLVSPGIYIVAELWDETARDIARIEPGQKWQRTRGGYVSDSAGNPTA